MEQSITGLSPIPIDYIRRYALAKATEPKRRPYAELVSDWGIEQDMAEVSKAIADDIMTGKTSGMDKRKLMKILLSLHTNYRYGKPLEDLTTLLKEIDELIQSYAVDWTWAHVMRVMIEHSILTTKVPNRFDVLVCTLLPGKGSGTVRKSGDYKIIETERPYASWIENPRDDFNEANDRRICMEIAQKLEPILFKQKGTESGAE